MVKSKIFALTYSEFKTLLGGVGPNISHNLAGLPCDKHNHYILRIHVVLNHVL